MAKKYLQLSQILKKLLFEKNMRPTELAKKTNVPEANIHRIITGESTNPFKTTTEPIANFFGISTDQLLGIEQLPTSAYSNKGITGDLRTKIIPLLAWEDLDNRSKLTLVEKEIIVMDVSDSAFAVKNRDYSMEPLFQKGSILIFEPEKEPQDRSFVLIKLHNPDCYIFRQIVFDLDQRHMKALNPDIGSSSLRIIEADDKVIATLVEDRRSYE